MGEGKITINFHSMLRVIAIVIIVLLLFLVLFLWFENSTQGHLALREAKNAKIAMEMLDKEYYAKNQCIFDKTTIYGLSDKSIEQIKELSNKNGSIYLKSFDMEKRRVTKFIYRNKRYEVTYQCDGEEEEYQIKRRKSSK